MRKRRRTAKSSCHLATLLAAAAASLLGCRGQGPDDSSYSVVLKGEWQKQYTMCTGGQVYCFTSTPISQTSNAKIRVDGNTATGMFPEETIAGTVAAYGPGTTQLVFGPDKRAGCVGYVLYATTMDEHTFSGTWIYQKDCHGLGLGGSFSGSK